ncbi:MAG TPA: asparagine synthase (glutamine-hydrolyzing) [Nitrospirales bacterium]|nr:asparagine synthase (glutamine-hydrolyzing) [Nitrospiraceae bacterium]HNP28708.1 asparagine synthase (glutamine-hydrolyzing) [Nitrospirales bacterium]
MCGVAAILKLRAVNCSTEILNAMRDEVSYRGPDDRGSKFYRRFGPIYSEWEGDQGESAWEIGLGHRRLSIFDLSTAGHQPMVYGKRFWIVYNGEVFNFIEIRAELKRLGHNFQSSTDTEVILAAYSEWGTDCFAYFRGMWGLLIFDSHRNEVILCRDRLGIKPLYLWEGSGLIAIASEIKQFLRIPGFNPKIDPMASTLYLQTGYEDSNRSFFCDVRPVPGGTWIRIALDGLKISSPESYWNPERVQVVVKSSNEAAELFSDKLKESVRIHLRSDVPVGCALSGGLDSSSIAVLVSAINNSHEVPLHTFTATFPEHKFDERQYVDAVLTNIHALPHFSTPDPREFLEDLDRFIWIHDEPVGNLSMYSGYCIARLTHEAGVPVTLNGQGGDEIFSGYWQTYFLHLRDLWRQGRLLDLASHFLGACLGKGNPNLMKQIPVMFRRYCSQNKKTLHLRNSLSELTPQHLQDIMVMDAHTRRVHEIRNMFLPRLLKWDDRNSMAFSVEGRYPFLDHQLIELCLSFEPSTLYSCGWTKQPLRLGLDKELPKKIRHRRDKIGFAAPQDDWLCGPLREEMEKLFKKNRPIWDYVQHDHAQSFLVKMLDGKANDESGQALFRMFIFDRWLEMFDMQP